MAKLGGKRKGAGRPKGKKTLETLTKELALKQFNERVDKSTDAFFNAAKNLAVGQMYIYRLDEEEKTGANGKKYTIKVPVLVTSSEEIKDAIDVLYADGESEDGTYYYATTKPADIKAIDSLMNRRHGRPKETVEHSGEIKGLVGLITQLDKNGTTSS